MRVIVATIAAVVLFALAISLARPQTLPHVVGNALVNADALIVYHGYSGAVTIAADIEQFRYVNGHLYVEMIDYGADGIFHNGFESP